jgi:hypothetical protein
VSRATDAVERAIGYNHGYEPQRVKLKNALEGHAGRPGVQSRRLCQVTGIPR